MLIWCGDIDLRKTFEKILMTKIFYVFWIMVFFSLSPFFSESNNLKAHILDWSSS
jgi:hypothetical protein